MLCVYHDVTAIPTLWSLVLLSNGEHANVYTVLSVQPAPNISHVQTSIT